MPRPAALSPYQIESVFQTINPFLGNGKVIRKSDKLWKQASLQLHNLVNGTTLYFYITKDWNNLKTKLTKYWAEKGAFKPNFQKEKPVYIIDSYEEKVFYFTYPEEKWNELKPIINEKDPSRFQLPKGWTHRVENMIIQATKTLCPFMFKKGWIVKKDDTIKITGKCNECGNEVKVLCDSFINRTFVIKTKDSSGIKHFSKRPMSNYRREEIGKKLINEKPLKVRRGLAKETIEYGQVDGPEIPKSPVLRKIAQEAIFKKYGVKSSVKDIVDEIYWMKSQDTWSNSLIQINDIPFSVIFVTPQQLDLWKSVSSQPDLTVSVDAAGRFVKKIKSGGEVTSHIFLYIISTSIGRKIYPLFQFISEYQASNFIKHCFDLWLAKGSPVPQEITMDHSKALLNACCLSFNKCTYKQYLVKVYDGLLNNEVNPFHCFVRIDIAHLIKAITRWKCFTGCDPCVKDFYTRLIGFLSKIESATEFFKIIRWIFTVCQNSDRSVVSAELGFLFELIKFHEIQKCSKDCECDECCGELKLADSEEEDNYVDSEVVPIKSIIEEIIEETRRSSNKAENSSNKYYCPNFIVNFSALCQEFVAWTNAATKFFSSQNLVATSGRSESLFSDLRHITNIHRPISAHLFIAIYFDFLIGCIILGKAYLEKQKLLSPVLHKALSEVKLKLISPSKSMDDCKVENIEPKQVRRRGKYLEPCKDVQIIHRRPNLQPFKTVLIDGALRPPLKHEDNKFYFYSSTCIFDSIFELIGTAYVNYGPFKDTVDTLCSNKYSLFSVLREYFQSGKQADLYKNRLRICVDHFEVNLNTMTLTYTDAVGDLLCTLLEKCSSNLFYIKIKKSLTNEVLNFEKLDCYIQNEIKSHPLSLEKFLFLDVSFFFEKKQVCNLLDLPERINIFKNEYLLTGLIIHTESEFDSNSNHYTCFCRSLTKSWRIKNNLNEQIQYVKKNTNLKISPNLIMYINNF